MMRSLLAGLLMLWAVPLYATEIFRFTDENGTIHFVDSIDKVPPAYRDKAKVRWSDRGESRPTAPKGASGSGKRAGLGVSTAFLLFPYQEVEGSAAMDGLWEDANKKPISRAKPVMVFKRKARIEIQRCFPVHYEADVAPPAKSAAKGGKRTAWYKESADLSVCEISVSSRDMVDVRSGEVVSVEQLSGFVLEERVR